MREGSSQKRIHGFLFGPDFWAGSQKERGPGIPLQDFLFASEGLKGHGRQGNNLAEPRGPGTNIKRPKIVFAVTRIALSLGHDCFWFPLYVRIESSRFPIAISHEV